MAMKMRYKVVFKAYGVWLDSYFSNLKCAYEYASRMNGIVLNAKKNGCE